MLKKGLLNKEQYEVIGMTKQADGSGYTLTFIIRDPNNKDGKVVGMVFVPEKQAKTLGKFLLDQIN